MKKADNIKKSIAKMIFEKFKQKEGRVPNILLALNKKKKS